MITHLLVIMAANRNRQGALLLAQTLGVLIAIWHVLCFLEKHAFPPVAHAALVGLLPTPSPPVTTAAITAVSAALATIYAYTRPNTADIDEVYSSSSMWIHFLNDD